MTSRIPAVLVALAASTAAFAQGDCPPGNLLAGLQPVEALDVYHVSRITDGVVSPDGAPWDNATNAPLTPQGYVIYDLGRPITLSAVFLQGEGSSSYGIAVSLDRATWTQVTRVPRAGSDGMHNRFARNLGTHARYLSFASGPGPKNSLHSIGEAAAWCRAPTEWPPRFKVREGLVRDQAWSDRRKTRIGYGKLVFVALSAGLFFAARRYPAQRSLAYATVIVGGVLAWTNFGTFHGPNFIHYHEHYHYYMGTEYFEENGYTGLYACTLWAERDLGLEAVARNRYVTDLENNLVVTGGELLDVEPPCRTKFTEERWEAFREDIRYFRNNLYPGSWQRVFRDHGYNTTPVWTLLGKTAGLFGSTAATTVPRVAGIDVLLWLAIGMLVLWAFDLETLAAMALTLGGGLPWNYAFTGGGFARFTWLLCLIAGICLLKKERPFAAGFALAVAASLRAFPAVFLGVLGMAAVVALVRRRPLRDYLRAFSGAAVGGALVIALSLAVVGPSSWSGFADNLRKHATTSFGNLMGVPAIVAYDPGSTQSDILTTEIESLQRWRLTRAETLRDRRIVLWPLAALFTGMCAWTVWRRDYPMWEWVVVALLLAVSLREISSYYYVFMLLLAFWVVARPLRLGLLSVGLVASLIIGLLGLPTDLRFVWLSVVFVALPAALWFLRVREERRDPPTVAER